MLDPPLDTNGNVTPVNGRISSTPKDVYKRQVPARILLTALSPVWMPDIISAVAVGERNGV